MSKLVDTTLSSLNVATRAMFCNQRFAVAAMALVTLLSSFKAPCCGQELASTSNSALKESPPKQPATEMKFRFDMADRTRIIGYADVQSIEVDLGFGKVAIPIEKIRSLTQTRRTLKDDSNDHFIIEMQNRDRYTGRVLNPPLKVRFLGGEVMLPFDGMRTLRFLSGGGGPASGLVSDGLVLYFDFEGISDDVAENQMGADHHGKMGDGIKRVASKHNRGIKFTGQRSLTVENHGSLCPQRFTFSAWMKPGARDGEYCFIGGMSKHTGWLGGFAFVYMEGDTDNIHFYVNGYNKYVVKAPFPAKRWTHLSGVLDGDNVILYANGEKIDSVPFSKGEAITYPEDPFTLGGEISDFFWQGEMDEVSLHNRALSAEEVKDLYESTKD